MMRRAYIPVLRADRTIQYRSCCRRINSFARILVVAAAFIVVWDKMVPHCLADNRCQSFECQKAASYGLRGTKSRRFCLKHKAPEHVYLVGKSCEHITQDHFRHPARTILGDADTSRLKCERRAFYGHEGEGVRRCSKHCLPGMVSCAAPLPFMLRRASVPILNDVGDATVPGESAQEHLSCQRLPQAAGLRLPWQEEGCICALTRVAMACLQAGGFKCAVACVWSERVRARCVLTSARVRGSA